jgi:hypothetical protein
MYQFDTSANQFYKLADHSESLASYLHAMDSIEYEGKRFISCSYNASPYLKTFVFDGSSVSSLPDTPTQAITSVDQANSGKFFIDNDQLFLVQANQDNLVSSTPSFDTYKYNGSGWDEVSAGDWQNYTPSSNNLEWLYTVSSGDYINSNLFGRCYSLQPFNVSGVTYLFARYYGGSVGWQNMRILEYVDGSGWFYREDISPGYAGMATTRSGMSAKEVNGNWYFYCHSNIILIRKPGWVWESIRTVGGATTYQSGYTKMSSLNNKPVLFLSLGTNKQHQRYTVSDYANQRVWYKRPITNNGTNGDSGPNDTVAYGIALQDGSKGDIIKIRRIKQ